MTERGVSGPTGGSSLARSAVVAWYVLAGYFLFIVPWAPQVWNESFYARERRLHELLTWLPIRVAVCAFGFVLLVAAVAEALSWRQERSGR